MRPIRLTCAVAAVAACAGMIPTLDAQQNPEPVTVNWSDPSRPGTLTMNTWMGDVTVRGSNRKDVLVSTRENTAASERTRQPRPARPPRPDGQDPADVPAGFRRLTPSRGFSLEERNNELSIQVNNFMRSSDFEIDVPARTNLRLTAVGRIVVEGVEGEIEVTSHGGSVNLTNVAGAVVAHSAGGPVTAVLSRVAADKAMSFTSFGGGVDVTLPASVKANLKLLSFEGDVYTDFDIQTRAPSPAPTPAPTPATAKPGPGGRDRSGRERVGRGPASPVDGTIYGTINGGGPEIELRTFGGRVLLRRGK